MLDTRRLEHVQDLIASKRHSLRAIARMTGIPRTTIRQIAGGRTPRRALRVQFNSDAADDNADEFAIPQPSATNDENPCSALPRGKSLRCETCGATVYPPCRACLVRRFMERRKLPESGSPRALVH